MHRRALALLLVLELSVAATAGAAGTLRDGLVQHYALRSAEGPIATEALLVTQWKGDEILQILLVANGGEDRLTLTRVYTPKKGISVRTIEDMASSWRAKLTERSGLVFQSLEQTARPDEVGELVSKGPRAVSRTLELPGEPPLVLAATTFDADDAVVQRLVQEAAAKTLPSRLAQSVPYSLSPQLALLQAVLKDPDAGAPGLLEFAPVVTALVGLLEAAAPTDPIWRGFQGAAWRFDGMGAHVGTELSGTDLKFAAQFGLKDAAHPLDHMQAGTE